MTDEQREKVQNFLRDFIIRLEKNEYSQIIYDDEWQIGYEGQELNNGEVGDFSYDKQTGICRLPVENIKTKEKYWVLFDLKENEISDMNKD